MNHLMARRTLLIQSTCSTFGASLAKHMTLRLKHHCPYCRSVEISKSRRRGAIEKYLFRAIGMRPYRCSICDARFFAFAISHHVAASPKAKAA
jgi:DNA-directed RNA polymerase subunit RPC12/RpoP